MIRFKLDENLHESMASFIRERGYEVATVEEQGLRGADDTTLAKICRREGRVFVTQDKDLADIRTFPPAASPGIIVIRLPRQGPRAALKAIAATLEKLETLPVGGALWIVEPGRIRVRRAGQKSKGRD